MNTKKLATGLAAILAAGAAKADSITFTDIDSTTNLENSALVDGSTAYSGNQAYDALSLSSGSTGNYAFGENKDGLALDPITGDIYGLAGAGVVNDDATLSYSLGFSSASALAV